MGKGDEVLSAFGTYQTQAALMVARVQLRFALLIAILPYILRRVRFFSECSPNWGRGVCSWMTSGFSVPDIGRSIW